MFELGLMTKDFAADIGALQRIDAVPRIIEIACRSTGMDFAAVTRVTDSRWSCCAIRDEIDFGLRPGGKLKLKQRSATIRAGTLEQSRTIGRFNLFAELIASHLNALDTLAERSNTAE